MPALGEVHVEAVPGNVECAVGEPAVVRGFGVIQRHLERGVPRQLASGEVAPKAGGICGRLRMQRLELRGGQLRARGERRRRRECALFQQDGLDIRVGHASPIGLFSRPEAYLARARAAKPLRKPATSLNANGLGAPACMA